MHKTILVTGATDGIGRVAAEKLATLGHRVLVHGRSADKLGQLVAELQGLAGGAVESFQADFSNLAEVEKMASHIVQQGLQIDVLINNAGVFKTPNPVTTDGLDSRFVVNTAAPVLLAQHLLPSIPSTGRIINLSSAAQQTVDLQALAGKKLLEDDYAAYAQSKLAITQWSHQLAGEFGDAGPTVIAVNPGSLLASKMVTEGFGVEGNDINIGADILVELALDEKHAAATGLYFDNDAGAYGQPHPDVLDAARSKATVAAIQQLLKDYVK